MAAVAVTFLLGVAAVRGFEGVFRFERLRLGGDSGFVVGSAEAVGGLLDSI